MLKQKDKIFQNLHGFDDAFLEGALKRGSWSNTKEILSKNENDIIMIPGKVELSFKTDSKKQDKDIIWISAYIHYFKN